MDTNKVPERIKSIPWIRYKKGVSFYYGYLELGLGNPDYDFHESIKFIIKDAKENGVKVAVERLQYGVRVVVLSRKFPFLPYTDEEADELGLPRHIPRDKGLTGKLKKMAIGDTIEEHPNKRSAAYTLARQINIKISCHKINDCCMKITRIG